MIIQAIISLSSVKKGDRLPFFRTNEMDFVVFPDFPEEQSVRYGAGIQLLTPCRDFDSREG